MTERRLAAARMFQMGKSQADVVRRFGASRQSASPWFAD
jgi:hypothetical protein